MRLLVLALPLAFFLDLGVAPDVAPASSVVAPGVEEFRKAGPCKLKKAGPFDDAKQVRVKLGRRIVATAKLYLDTFFEKTIINANLEVENTTEEPVFCHYYAAFFDEQKRMVGCVGQASFGDDGLNGGEKTQFGSCMIPLPQSVIDTVTSYQIMFYESDAAIGKEGTAKKRGK